MGQFLFDVPDSASEFFGSCLWQDAYVCGIEGVPWQCHNRFEAQKLTVSRSIDSSGKLHLTCPVADVGYRTLSTCSLRPGSMVYSLPLELARGCCYRCRVQADAWQRAGLTLNEEFEDLLAKGTGKFLDSAQLRGDRDRSCEAALESIAYLEKAIEVLGELYAVQSISFRKQREPQIGTLLAATVVPPSPVDSDRESEFISAFNSAAIRLSWSEIENDAGSYDYTAAKQSIQWCASHGIRVVGGPLLDFRDRLLPHWLYLLEDDFEAFLGAVTQFVEKTVEEFRGTVQLWNCAAGLNTNGPITLDDEQAMRLAIGILQTVRRADPNTPTIFSFDQPFGEYLSKSRDGISPLHFADALARSGLGLAGFGLEVRLNYRPNGTLPRSAVEFGQMVDRWATLGMPLLVQLVIPGGRGSDPLAVAPSDLLELPQPPANPSAEQLRIAGPIVRTLLAKHIVHGIVWDGWSDAEPHVLSHAGMVDAAGRSRPLLEYLTRIRRDFLT